MYKNGKEHLIRRINEGFTDEEIVFLYDNIDSLIENTIVRELFPRLHEVKVKIKEKFHWFGKQ